MDIRQIVYFVEIAKAGAYSAAAKRLFISQPALSKAVKTLEQGLNTRLFVQVGNKTTLTDVGRVLFDEAQRLIEDYRGLIDAVNEVTELQRGCMRFGVPSGLGVILFDALISAFSARYPNIEISITGHGSRYIRNAVLAGKVDVGATIIPPALDQRLKGTAVISDSFFLMVPAGHRLAGQKSAHFADLKDETFVMYDEEFIMTELTHRNCRAAGFSPRVGVTATRTDLIADMVGKGRGVAAVAGGRWRFDHWPNVVTLGLEGEGTRFDIALVTQAKGYLPHAVRRFVEFCAEHGPGTHKQKLCPP